MSEIPPELPKERRQELRALLKQQRAHVRKRLAPTHGVRVRQIPWGESGADLDDYASRRRDATRGTVRPPGAVTTKKEAK